MRGLESNKTKIRHKIFTEIARVAYEGGDMAHEIERLPYKVVPGEVATYRDSIFLERAVVGERLRLAMGLPLRQFNEHSELSDGVDESTIAEKYYVLPGLPGAPLPGGVSPEGHLHGGPEKRHRSEQVHQVRALRGCLLLSRHHPPGAALLRRLRYGRHSLR